MGKFHDEAGSGINNWWRISGWESFMMKLRVQIATGGESLGGQVS